MTAAIHPAVATHDLSLRYGRETALDRIDLRVEEGSIYVLAGANGAGKSSAMKLLLNLERPDSGRAEVFGLDTTAEGPRVRAQIGYIPETHVQSQGWVTCARLIQYVSRHYPSWDAAYAGRLIGIFDVPLHRKVGSLSKGESRRLQFVLALSHRPPLLLLDEPTDALDPIVRNRTLTTLTEHLADAPTTVVISTHHIGEVESLADHIGVLRAGRLTAQISRDDLRRTMRRYRAEVGEGWRPPSELRVSSLRRPSGGREVEALIIGEESEVIARLTSGGATVREVTTPDLEDAVLALLTEEVSS